MGKEKNTAGGSEGKTGGRGRKAIIFDFDDTLVDTKRIAVGKHLAAAKKLGIKFNEREFLSRYGQPWPKILFEMMGSEAQGLVDTMREMEGFELRQIEGAGIAVDHARKKGLFVGLLSSSERDWIMKKCAETSISLDCFHRHLVCCGDEVKENKPSPLAFEPILSALAAEGLGPDKVYYYGDSMIDLETARSVGVNFIAVTTGIHKKKDFINAGLEVNMILDSVKELPSKLKELGAVG